jgi:aldehyde:ferredoxin oxidoreductase
MGRLNGESLLIRLAAETAESTELDEDLYRKFLGGRGIGSFLMAEAVPSRDVDPLAPENPLLLTAGLLTGTRAPTSARLHVTARSPMTGLLGSSNVGGRFGAALQKTGFRTITIQERAPHPVLILVDGHRAEIRDASDLWGLRTSEAADRLKERFGRRAECAVIGPGGENLVPFANIMTGRRHAAGRTGLGAVMGSKRVKAIVVRGGEHMGPLEDADRAVIRAYRRRIRESSRYDTYSRYGNSGYAEWLDGQGAMPARNFRHVRFEQAGRVDGKKLTDEYVTRPRACHRCPVHCKADFKIPTGPYAGTEGARPDIDPLVSMGPRCGLDDPDALLYLHNLTGELGIDVISTGGVLAFAMDLYERGILSREDCDGIDLTWGNAEAMEEMIYRIAAREGLGAVLAQGVRGAAEIIGKGSAAYAYHVKGLELPGYDPRGFMGTALGYAVANRGADFATVYAIPEYRWEGEEGRKWFGSERSVDRLSTEGKGRLVRRAMIVSAVLDAIGLCKIAVLSVVGDLSLRHEAELVRALTPWSVDAKDLALAGERIVNLERAFNLRMGSEAKDDDLPDQFTERRVSDPGPTFGMTVNIQPMVRAFYRAMGWDEDGRPTQEKLVELGLAGESDGTLPAGA